MIVAAWSAAQLLSGERSHGNGPLVFSETQTLRAARLVADIATKPRAVMEKLPMHSLTDLGLARFPRRGESSRSRLAPALYRPAAIG